jgi:cobyrinic acid a,c-diamide synthase
MRDVKVAVAFDDAFHRYFTDTLDLLELNGAVLRDFSPLADADLPAGTDVVYLGCGHVERFAAALAANPCMIAALRRHGSGGGRIYAEGGAAGYLCDKIELETGESIPMCGILPAVARHRSHGATPTLVDVSLSEQCWLGAKGYHLRGYRNRHWRMESISPHWSIANRIATERPTLDSDLLCRDNVIASQVHLNLVAQPHLLSSFAPATAIAPV